MAVCEGGEVWCWGQNRCGALGPVGVRVGEACPLPRTLRQANAHATFTVLQLACGAAHCLALDQHGNVYSWGGNGSGQCGVDAYGLVTTPMRVLFVPEARIASISCGRYHSAAVSTMGQVYTWGQNMRGELGQDLVSMEVYNPNVIDDFWYTVGSGADLDFEPVRAVSVHCGLDHTVVLSDQGKVYVCGNNKYRSLQIADGKHRIGWFNRLDKLPARVRSVITSNKSRVSAAITDNGIYSWGLRNGCSVLSRHFKLVGDAPGNGIVQLFADRPSPCFKKSPVAQCQRPSALLESIIVEPRLTIDVAAFYNNIYLSDVTLKVRGELIACHQFILRWRCPHFANLLKGESAITLRKDHVKVLVINEYDIFVYTSFIRYLYTGELQPLDGYQLIEMWCIAKAYRLEDLKCSTMRLFSDRLSLTNYKLLFNLVVEKKAFELENVLIAYLELENEISVTRKAEEFENLETINDEVKLKSVVRLLKECKSVETSSEECQETSDDCMERTNSPLTSDWEDFESSEADYLSEIEMDAAQVMRTSL